MRVRTSLLRISNSSTPQLALELLLHPSPIRFKKWPTRQVLPLLLTDGMSLPGFIQGIKYLSVFQDPSGSLVKARALILDAYNKKEASIASQLKVTEEKNSLALLGIGAFLFWAFGK